MAYSVSGMPVDIAIFVEMFFTENFVRVNVTLKDTSSEDVFVAIVIITKDVLIS